MEKSEKNPDFLKQRFSGLYRSPEVKNSVRRTETRTGEKLTDNPETHIQNYLDRFKEIIERTDPKDKERGINALKKILIDKYIIRVEDIPEAYWQAQMRVVRERGEAGDWDSLPEDQKLEFKQKHLVITKEDQKGSLEEWIDYLASDRSAYLPDYLKYWSFQGMLQLERYEKANKEHNTPSRFPKRPTGKQRSVKMFPEVNARGLEFIAQAYKTESAQQSIDFRYDIPKEAREQFSEYLRAKDFRAIYGWVQEYMPPISEQEMKTTEGEWIEYPQNSDPKALTEQLQGKGSGWCIAGENLAEEYLTRGNLHVYYTKDREGKLSIPRVVIVEKDNRVTEVRGIEWQENIDDNIKATNIIGDKLRQLPAGEAFTDIDRDTKQLTTIEHKSSTGEILSRDDLIFLYEIERPITYFGYKPDPRIAELRNRRNQEEDMLVIFECTREQIAHVPDEINDNTKAYVGPICQTVIDSKTDKEEVAPKYRNIFKKIGHLEHVYTSFPEARIQKESINIGGKYPEELRAECYKLEINISDGGFNMMESKDFFVREEPESIDLIKLKLADIGFKNNVPIDQIYRRAEILGLELCPADTGPQYFLKYHNQSFNGSLNIGMRPIDSYGDPCIFELQRSDHNLWLDGVSVSSTDPWWRPSNYFLFRLPPSSSTPPEINNSGF